MAVLIVTNKHCLICRQIGASESVDFEGERKILQLNANASCKTFAKNGLW